jgi:hypothetical protein
MGVYIGLIEGGIRLHWAVSTTLDEEKIDSSLMHTSGRLGLELDANAFCASFRPSTSPWHSHFSA